MLAGPIFRVEMVSVARRSRYFLLRVCYALLILLILWISYSSVSLFGANRQMSIKQASNLATEFFLSFSWLQLLMVLAVAPALAVGTISTERERRTIEYLFTTDLSNLEIVLGKTIARLLVIGKFLLLALPILFLFRLLGGIPADLLAASFLIGGSTALVVTAIGVCISVWSPRSRDGILRVYLLLGALLLLPLIFYSIIRMNSQALGPLAPVVISALEGLNAVNPLMVLGESMGNRYSAGAGFDFAPVWTMAAWHLAISCGCIALATAAVRRVHLRSSGKADKTDSPDKPVGSLRNATRKLLRGWRPPLGERPMLWKEAFAGTSRSNLGFAGFLAAAMIVATIFGLTVWAFLEHLASNYNDEQYFGYLIGLTPVVGSGMLLILASRAAGLVTLEKERDCWLSLVSTPLTSGEILRGKILGNLYAARWALALLLFAWLLGVFLNPAFVLAAVAMTAAFLACALFASTLGVFYSLRSDTTLKASGATLGTLLVVGGGYFMCCCPVVGVMGPGGGEVLISFVLAPCIPFLLGFPASFGMWNVGRGSVDEELIYMSIAFCLGTVGYAIASYAIYASMKESFDKRSGRTLSRMARKPSPVVLTPLEG